jgi:hypothetical protein
MAGTIRGLASAYQSGNRPKSARAYIIPLDNDNHKDDRPLTDQLRALQYFPESIHDNKVTNWQPKEIPGLSHPLYQWTTGGAREIGFTAIFTRDTATPDEDKRTGWKPDFFALANGTKNTNEPRDVDIPSAIQWLRSFKYPGYSGPTGSGNVSYPVPPRKMILGMPGVGLNHGDQSLLADEIHCIMLACDVTYDAFFNNGVPRIAKVNLNFAEIIQIGGMVRVQDSSTLRAGGLGGYNLSDIGVSTLNSRRGQDK